MVNSTLLGRKLGMQCSLGVEHDQNTRKCPALPHPIQQLMPLLHLRTNVHKIPISHFAPFSHQPNGNFPAIENPKMHSSGFFLQYHLYWLIMYKTHFNIFLGLGLEQYYDHLPI